MAEAIAQRLATAHMTREEVLARLAELARADLGVFFRVAERWTAHPLPSQEIVAERDGVDKATGEPAREYLVRYVVLDAERLLDGKYSRTLRTFKDSPRGGLSVEVHSVPAALQMLARALGLSTQRVEVASTGPAPQVTFYLPENGREETKAAGDSAGDEGAGAQLSLWG